MARALDRDKLLAAFDDIGRAAATAGTTLQIVVYGRARKVMRVQWSFAQIPPESAPPPARRDWGAEPQLPL